MKYYPPDIKKEYKKLASIISEPYVRKSLTDSLMEYEERMIRKALIDSQWNQSEAARTLKLSVQSLRYKMAKLGIIKPW